MSKKTFIIYGAALLAAGGAQGQNASEDNARKPNILFILCDDMGYGDLACYGQQLISTPNIDRLAAEGMRFTQAYAGSPVSAPSRATLMTGQHTGHTEVRGNKEYWNNNAMNAQIGVNRDYDRVGQMPYAENHVILPEIMKQAGYTTGMFGKWAGGYEGSVSTPDKRGIDEFFGYICQYQAHWYYPNFLNRYSRSKGDTGTIRIPLTENASTLKSSDADYHRRPQYSADLIHQAAMEWLDKQQPDGQPFYGFFTYTLPHAELVQPQDSILNLYYGKFCEDHDVGKSSDGSYNATKNVHAQFAAMITRLDAYVGEIMQKLKEKGLDENTIVIFSSDNGPHEEGGADPAFFNRDGLLRGLKRQCYEGGIRIPFIVKWQDKVKPGTVNDHQLAFYDIMPTFCDIAGIAGFPEKFRNSSGQGDYFDGISFYPTLMGKDEEQKAHDYLYWEFHETNQIAVRRGNWKLVVRGGNCELYDLANDIHEDHNVAADYPEVVKELKDIVYEAHTPSQNFQVTLPAR